MIDRMMGILKIPAVPHSVRYELSAGEALRIMGFRVAGQGLEGALASWRRFAVTVDSREFLSIDFQYWGEVSLWGLNDLQPLFNLFITQFDV